MTNKLSPEALAEIRERQNVRRRSLELQVYVDDIDALLAHIAVVEGERKARNILLLELSGRGDMLAKEHVNPDALDGFVAAQNEFDRLRNIVIRDLEARLREVEGERDVAVVKVKEAIRLIHSDESEGGDYTSGMALLCEIAGYRYPSKEAMQNARSMSIFEAMKLPAVDKAK